jgi:hypothetical protein
MATAADAELVLRLYELRREETLRKARRFLVFDFNPKTLEELRAVTRDTKSQFNPYWRQAMSFWEMAHSMVLRGAVDPDLFLDSNVEGSLSMLSSTTFTRRRRSRAATHLWGRRPS